MQPREHSDGWNAGGWQQVSLSFSTRVAGEVQRLAGRIRRQFTGGLLQQWHRPWLPLWSPDYSAFTGAIWAERLVSRVCDTLNSLSAVPREMPSFDWKPGRLVWFKPGSARAALWPEGEDDGIVDAAYSGATDVAPGRAGPDEHGAPADAGESAATGALAEAATRPRRRPRTVPVIGTVPFSPGTSLLRMRPRGRALVGKEPRAADMATFRPHPAVGARATEMGVTAEDGMVGGLETASPTARVEPRGAALRGPLRPPVTLGHPRAAPYPGLVHRALAAVERTVEFSRRILAGPTERWPDEALMPPAFPSGAPVGEPRGAAGAAAHAAGSDAGAPGPGRPSGVTRAVSLSRWERRRSPATEAGEGRGLPLARRVELPDDAASVELARAGGETGVPPATPRRGMAGLGHGRSEMVVPPVELALASMPAAEPRMEERSVVDAFESIAGGRADRREEVAADGRRVPDRAALPTALAVSAMGAGRLSHPSSGGGGVAFALAGRSTAGEGAAAAGEPTGSIEGEEGGGVNIEQLAREVYVVLRRRLAWERERNLASRA